MSDQTPQASPADTAPTEAEPKETQPTVAEPTGAEPVGTAPGDAATREFVTHRELLFSIVYNVLGTVADTEDVLQETWLAWEPRRQATTAEPIESPRAYLVRIAVNKALTRQDAIRRRRETYVGPWLPEPLLTPEVAPSPTATPPEDAAETVIRAESVSIALMVVLETLTPLERAVFVLHEVFGYPHREIAAILDRNPAAVRQLARRAREHVHARRPRYEPEPDLQRRVTQRFTEAVAGGDLDALLQLLAPDVVLHPDSGGKGPAFTTVVLTGREEVATLLCPGRQSRPRAMDIRYQRVNGRPSALMYRDGRPVAVLAVDLAPGSDQVSGIYYVSNPDKLSQLV